MKIYFRHTAILFLNSVLLGAQLLTASTLFAQTRSGSQAEWEKINKAAKTERQLRIYGNTGYDSIFSAFRERYPEIEITSVTGEGRELVPRLLSERRAGKYLADLFLAGASGFFTMHQAKALDTLRPALLLPEVADESKWWQGKHHYMDSDGGYILAFSGYPRVDIVYNTNLVKPDTLKSYWDLLHPKWKGKVVAYDQISASQRFFYYHQELGPEFMNRFFDEMEPTLSGDFRQIADWLAVGKFALGFFVSPTNLSIARAKKQGLPIGFFEPNQFKEGAIMLAGAGIAGLMTQAPHPNAARLALNWLLSREGQIAYQEAYANEGGGAESLRIDIPKDKIPSHLRRKEGVKSLFVDRPEWIDARPVQKLIADIRAKKANK